MKLIKPSFDIIGQGPGIDGIYKQIELAGRTCYKSEDKITTDSAERFVNALIKSGHCYTGESEVLTDKGWIKWREYSGEKVAVVDTNRKFLGFEFPKNIIKHTYKGNFYYYPTIGLEVTDGHNMFGMLADTSEQRYSDFKGKLFTCLEKYKDANGRLKTLGERWFKTSSVCNYIPKMLPTFQLIGMWLGDGCKDSGKNTLRFHIKKQRKIEYLKTICNKIGYDWEYKNYNFYVIEKGIGNFFRQNFLKDDKKFINPNLSNQDEIYSIIDGLINSDGHIGKTDISFSNTSDYLIDFILNKGCIVGLNPIESTKKKNNLRTIFLLKRKENISNDSRKTNSKVVIEYKEKDVYCVAVSSGIIIVRGTNGVISLCGNCSVLEHGTVYLKTVRYIDKRGRELGDKLGLTESNFSVPGKPGYKYDNKHYYFKYKDNPYSKLVDKSVDGIDIHYITTNYRTLTENGWLDDLKFQCEPTEYHEKRVTVRFVCDRGVLAEFTRHRIFSFSAESTRYCNYSRDRFGNEVTFIEPCWPYGEPLRDGFPEFITALSEAENHYLFLIENGWKPQQARAVLPNALKTELVMTGFVSDWKDFFDLRCAPSAHPQAQELAIPLREEFVKLKLI